MKLSVSYLSVKRKNVPEVISMLDATNVDVSFRYEITVEPNEDSPVTELVATRYQINGEEAITLESRVRTSLIKLS